MLQTVESDTGPDHIEDPQALPLGDAEIRELLRTRLQSATSRRRDAVVIEELGLRSQARLDLALVASLLHGYEIKSDRDSLRRLERQAGVYGEVLDRVTLVVGARHVDEALGLVPNWWGVLVVTGSRSRYRMVRQRTEQDNPCRSARAIVELLWLEDALSLLEARGAARGYRSKPRHIVWDRVCEIYTIDEIATEVRAKLKARTRLRSALPSC